MTTKRKPGSFRVSDSEPENSPSLPDFENPEIPEDEDADFKEVAGAMSVDISQQAWDWIERKKATDLEITATLYRVKIQGGMQQCGKWKNQIPDAHSCGLVHGSGKYVLLVTYPKRGTNPPGVKRYEFDLDKYYDTLKQEAEMMGTTPALGRLSIQHPIQPVQIPAAQGNGNNNSNDTLAIIQALLPILQPPVKPDNTLAQMMQMYQMMGFVMKKSLLDQTDFLQQMQERMLDTLPPTGTPSNPDGEQDTMAASALEKPKGMLETLLPYIMPFLEKMTSSNPAEKTATAALVNSIPAVQSIMTDPKHKEDCSNLIKYMDKKLKPEKTDEILKALKVDRGTYL